MKTLIVVLLSCLSIQAQTRIVNANIKNVTIGTTNVTGGGGDTQWISLTSSGTPRANFDGTVGCIFTVSSTITVTSLARYVISGSTQSHRVGIWNGSGSFIGDVTVSTSGVSTGWKFVTLVSPIVLTAGTYSMGSEEFNLGDSWYNDDSVISTTSAATITSSGFISGVYSHPDTTSTAGVHCFVPVSFLYH